MESAPLDLEKHLAEIDEQGYTVLRNAIAPAFCDEIARTLASLERELGVGTCSNDFEGRETVRVYNLLAHDEVFAKIPVHESVLPVVEGVLDDGCLISSLSSIRIGPGETPQLIHCDDQVIALPRPHPPLVCNTMWAITDFTEANGATRLVPGSHRDPNWPTPGADHHTIAAEMPRGSVLVWTGSLWHGGGANQTDEPRMGIAMNYCAGFIRQQENQQLGVPREKARGFPERLQRLLGYGVYRSLIGHIDKQDPIGLLGGDSGLRAVWDDG